MPAPAITPETIIALLIEQDILSSEEPVLADSNLFTLGLDSLAMMRLHLHMERELELHIPPQEITGDHFMTPAKLAEWLSQLSQKLS
jgi:acyl carrier protein